MNLLHLKPFAKKKTSGSCFGNRQYGVPDIWLTKAQNAYLCSETAA